MERLKKIITTLKKKSFVESILQFGSSLERKDYRDIDLCIMTTKKVSFKQKLALQRDIPEKYDISFYDDLPLNLKKEVLSKGKILFTKNYYHVLRQLQYVDLEYPRFHAFLKAYHHAQMPSI